MIAYFTAGNFKKLSKIIKSTKNFKKIYILNFDNIIEKSQIKNVDSDVAAYILSEQIKNTIKTVYNSKKYSSIIIVHSNISEIAIYEFMELCRVENVYFTQHILYDHDDSIDIKLYNLFDFVM